MTGAVENAPTGPQGGGGTVPPRKPNSVRRTTSIDTTWPQGRDRPARFDARARDALTRHDGTISALDTRQVWGSADLQRHLLEIDAPGVEADLAPLVGLRAGGQLRARLREMFPEHQAAQSALYLLLDDLAGATLVSSWAWFAWDGYTEALGKIVRGADISGWNGSMRGICIGLRDGSSALDTHGFPKMEEQFSAAVGDLARADDPNGWHAFPAYSGASMRRARWIDVSRNGSLVVADCGFQDSGARPDGGRQAIHEYRLEATVDAQGTLIDIKATPHVLPHSDCPAAVLNLHRLIGAGITGLRTTVPHLLAKEDGCTHLNDVIRALVGIPALISHLDTYPSEV